MGYEEMQPLTAYRVIQGSSDGTYREGDIIRI